MLGSLCLLLFVLTHMRKMRNERYSHALPVPFDRSVSWLFLSTGKKDTAVKEERKNERKK